MARDKIPYLVPYVEESLRDILHWIWNAIDKLLTDYASLSEVNVFEKNQSTEEVELTWASTITIDASLSNNFRVTLQGNTVFASPINKTAGMVMNIAISQDAVGSRTATFGSDWDFGKAGAPTLSTAANELDFISTYYTGGRQKWITIFWKGST